MTRLDAARRPPREQSAGEPPADGRRTDTRNRIHDVALAVFSERGWEGATLREIAERLAPPLPPPQYHKRSREATLASIHCGLARSVDGILDWARAQAAPATTRAEILRR